jgi:sodium-dependent dicarboxylate transporter 2/3/5
VILLIGGGLALGAAIDQSGLASWASERLPTAGVAPFILLGIIAVFAAAVSSVMSNTAAINLIAPIVMGLSGVPHAALLLVAAFACTLSMPLPVSTPPNAMAYSFSLRPDGKGEFTSRDMVVPGLFITVAGLALLALFSEVWFPRFFEF